MGLIWLVGAAVWGVAEATLFFIVPDVLITFAAARFGLRRVLGLSFVTAVTAAIGGAAMWWYGAHDPAAARAFVQSIPAVGPDLLAKAHDGIAAADWPIKLVVASLTGTPFKLYAVEAGAQGIDPYLFVALSIPARLIRFIITASLAAAGDALFWKWGIRRWRYPTLALIWIAVYAVYWTMRATT